MDERGGNIPIGVVSRSTFCHLHVPHLQRCPPPIGAAASPRTSNCNKQGHTKYLPRRPRQDKTAQMLDASNKVKFNSKLTKQGLQQPKTWSATENKRAQSESDEMGVMTTHSRAIGAEPKPNVDRTYPSLWTRLEIPQCCAEPLTNHCQTDTPPKPA